MMVLMIVGIKCNKYPGICKYFENFIEIFYINLPNTVKPVRNRHLQFLKKGFVKGVLLDSMFALYRFKNCWLFANKVKIKIDFLFSLKIIRIWTLFRQCYTE